MAKGCVLVTRPLAAARRIAEQLAAHGWDSFIEPLLTVTPIDTPLPDLQHFAALVFTSAHGVEVFAARSAQRDLPVYTVGATTATAAQDAGFVTVHTAAGDGAALNRMLATLPNSGPLLHVGGRHVAVEIAASGHRVERLVLYAAQPVTALSAECLARLEAGKISHALFFSARTGETFSRLIGKHKPALTAIKALSLSDWW